MIEVNNLTFTYKTNPDPTIRGISFAIGEGEIFGFLGPSGAGKSTTQKILIKILKGYSGDVSVMGKKLDTWDGSFFENVGVGFELPNHYSKLTARENLKFFSAFYSKKTRKPEELLEMVDLQEDIDKKIESYSKGMKMRLNFVRAIMHDPQLIFLDEPTSGLDPVNSRRLKDIILDLKQKGKTIFITTHNMHDADELCDKVSFIVDGKLSITDSPHNLKLMNGKRTVKVEYGNGNTQQKVFDLNNLGSNQEFLKLIKEENLAAIHSQEATLDEIFIKTTGQKL